MLFVRLRLQHSVFNLHLVYGRYHLGRDAEEKPDTPCLIVWKISSLFKPSAEAFYAVARIVEVDTHAQFVLTSSQSVGITGI
jgi:hypothetical protein